MLNFKEYNKILEEQLLKFGGKTNPTGSVVVLAGGAGSGKSTIVNTMFGFNGKIFNSDKFKEAFDSQKNKNFGYLKSIFDNHPDEFKEAGLDLNKNVDLGNKETVGKLHHLVKKLKLDTKERETFYRAVTPNLDNIIIDGTFEKMGSTKSKIKEAIDAGYDPKDIHLVWVLNTLENSLDNNNMRARSIPDSVVISIAKNAAKNMKSIFSDSEFQKICQGDWYVVFNGFNAKNKTNDVRNPAKIRRTIIADYSLLKKQGQKPNLSSIEKEIIDRIMDYTNGEFS